MMSAKFLLLEYLGVAFAKQPPLVTAVVNDETFNFGVFKWALLEFIAYQEIFITRRFSMNNVYRLAILFYLCAFSLAGCAPVPNSTSGRVVVQDDHGMIDIVFSDHDREVIRKYYGDAFKSKHKSLPPGLAKKDKLPPGLEKQLVRRGQLPPGLQYDRFPSDLERQLSQIPDDYLRVVIDGSFVLFNRKTNVIFDVMHDL